MLSWAVEGHQEKVASTSTAFGPVSSRVSPDTGASAYAGAGASFVRV